MTLLEKMCNRDIERKVSGNHPLLKMGVGRDVRDAYFTGLVFAACADDGKVDERERSCLDKVGSALDIPSQEAAELIADVESKDGNEKISLIEEVCKSLSGEKLAELFLSEFTFIWLSHNTVGDELATYRATLADWMGTAYDAKAFTLIDEAIVAKADKQSKIDRIANLSPDMLTYLFPKGAEVKYEKPTSEEKIESGNAESAKMKVPVNAELEASMLQMIESKTHWNTSFDGNSIRRMFEKVGVKEHFVRTLLSMMLPHAKKAWLNAKAVLDRKPSRPDKSDSDYASGGDYWGYDFRRNPAFIRAIVFFRFMDNCSTLSHRFSIVDKLLPEDSPGVRHEKDGELLRVKWTWRGHSNEIEKRKEFCDLYEALLSEFAYRASY